MTDTRTAEIAVTASLVEQATCTLLDDRYRRFGVRMVAFQQTRPTGWRAEFHTPGGVMSIVTGSTALDLLTRLDEQILLVTRAARTCRWCRNLYTDPVAKHLHQMLCEDLLGREVDA